jgi:hypothetical protein
MRAVLIIDILGELIGRVTEDPGPAAALVVCPNSPIAEAL